MLQSNERRFYFATILGLPQAVILLATPKRRRWRALMGLMVETLLVTISSCGGGGGGTHQQDPGTPAGTYTVTVIATAGSLSAQGTFILTVK